MGALLKKILKKRILLLPLIGAVLSFVFLVNISMAQFSGPTLLPPGGQPGGGLFSGIATRLPFWQTNSSLSSTNGIIYNDSSNQTTIRNLVITSGAGLGRFLTSTDSNGTAVWSDINIGQYQSRIQNNGCPVGQVLNGVDVNGVPTCITSTANFDFSLTSSTPSGITVTQGNTASSILTATLSGGSSQNVSFTVSGNPAGVTPTFSPSAGCTPNNQCSVTLNLSVGSSVTASTYNITVTGTSGSVVKTTNFNLTVSTAPAAFNFSLSNSTPSGISITQGSSTSSTISASLTSGTTQPVSLSLSYSSATGLSASLSSSNCSPTCSSIVNISTTSSTPTGTYSFTVTGVGGSVSQTTAFSLVVNASGGGGGGGGGGDCNSSFYSVGPPSISGTSVTNYAKTNCYISNPYGTGYVSGAGFEYNTLSSFYPPTSITAYFLSSYGVINGGQFSAATSGLQCGTTYYYKAFVIPTGSSTRVYSSAQTLTTIACLPTATISISPTSASYGGYTYVSWSSTNATSCTASGNSNWSGSVGTSGSNSYRGPFYSSATFYLSCTGLGGTSSTAQAYLSVSSPPPPPSISLYIWNGSAWSSSAYLWATANPYLTWSTANATSCTASGLWSGGKPTSSGSIQQSARDTGGSYTLQCTGPGGTTTSSVNLSVAWQRCPNRIQYTIFGVGCGTSPKDTTCDGNYWKYSSLQSWTPNDGYRCYYRKTTFGGMVCDNTSYYYDNCSTEAW